MKRFLSFFKMLKDSGLKNRILSVLFLVLIGVFFAWPVLRNIDYWPASRHDAGVNLSMIFLERSSVVDFSQFPLWSPAIQGGEPVFAQPFCLFPSPFFFLIIIFGELIGIKIYIVLSLVFGLCGMFLLSRQLKMQTFSSLLPGFIFLFSSTYSLLVAEGAYFYITIIWFPWIFWSFINGRKDFRYLFLCSLFCLLVLLSGGVNPVLFYAFILMFLYSSGLSLKYRRPKPIIRFLIVSILFFLLSLFKLLPMMLLLLKNDLSYSVVPFFNSFQLMLHSLFNPVQILNLNRNALFGMPPEAACYWEFHGAYIGILSFILFVGKLKSLVKKYPVLIFTCLSFLLLSALNIWHDFDPAGDFWFWKLFYRSSRFKWVFLFLFSISLGLIFSEEEKKFPENPKRKPFVLFLMAVIVTDLILVSRPILEEAFTQPAERIVKEKSFRQGYDQTIWIDALRTYPLLLSNRGICMENGFYDSGAVLCNALPEQSESYAGEVSFLKQEGQATVKFFSPNRIEVEVETLIDDILIINQNYDPGWKVLDSDSPVFSTNGLISVKVGEADEGRIIFYYFPDSLMLGAIISGLSLVLILLKINRLIGNRTFVLIIVLLLTISVFMGFALKKAFPPDLGPKYFSRGLKSEKKGLVGKAVREFEKAKYFSPNSAAIQERLFKLYVEQGLSEKTAASQSGIHGLAGCKAEVF